MEKIVSHSEEETVLAGEQFSTRLAAGDIVALYGDLGSGKTRFVKGVSKGMGVTEHVASPTFVIVSEHLHGRIPLYHFDCYRVNAGSELRELGFDDYLYGDGVCLLEWADRIEEHLPKERYNIFFTMGENKTERFISIESNR